MRMFVYSVMPIDSWAGWHKPHEIFRVYPEPADIDERFLDAADWYRFWEGAKKLAAKLYWEGDIREGPYVAPLPLSDSGVTTFIVAWKQDNNGTTFVASEYRLEHLKDEDGGGFVEGTV